MGSEARLVYVGCGDWNGDTGRIQVYAFDRSAARLELVQEVAAGGVAAFMARSVDGATLYVADEAKGRLASYRVDPRSGELAPLNEIQAGGHPVYLAVHQSGGYLATCYFAEAKAEIFSLQVDGSLGASVCQVDSGAESHCCAFDSTHRCLFVPTRGAGWVAQYRFEAETGQLHESDPPRQLEREGAGPRHMAFHPNGLYAYLLCELSLTLSSYRVDPSRGVLEPIERGVSTRLGSGDGGSAADIHVHPAGRFLYVSNRQGDRSNMAIFSIDEETGAAALVGHEFTRGITPRNFDIDPMGKWLIVGNRESPNVSIFEVEQAGARLSYRGSRDVAPGPFYVGIY